MCPYKQATQREGHASTSLGTWEGLYEEGTVMQFGGGAGCWQGPARSLRVSVCVRVCGGRVAWRGRASKVFGCLDTLMCGPTEELTHKHAPPPPSPLRSR